MSIKKKIFTCIALCFVLCALLLCVLMSNVTESFASTNMQKLISGFEQDMCASTSRLTSTGVLSNSQDFAASPDSLSRANTVLKSNKNSSTTISTTSTLPSKFDLRSADLDGNGVYRNYVTSGKNQEPWGTCWAFGNISAGEASILSELRQEARLKNAEGKYTTDTLDLSEHHLSWFVKNHLPSVQSACNNQGGEGCYQRPEYIHKNPMSDADPFHATTTYATGSGAVLESKAPYWGLLKKIAYGHGSFKDKDFHYDDNPEGGFPFCYSDSDDWSLGEDTRFDCDYTLEESFSLQKPIEKDESGKFTVLNENAMNDIKSQIVSGRGVQVAYWCDPTCNPDTERHINLSNYSHYTWDATDDNPDHIVCIVGYDDNYSRQNFKSSPAAKLADGHDILYDEHGNVVYEETNTPLPPGDGAWIVKNSWGAENSAWPNNGKSWGDDGIFYISYYSGDMCEFEALDFVTKNDSDFVNHTITQQYDYMPAQTASFVESTTPVAAANVFSAPQDMNICELSVVTSKPDTTVQWVLLSFEGQEYDFNKATIKAEMSQTYHNGGFHRKNLDSPVFVKGGDKYAIIAYETYKKADGSQIYEVMANKALNEAGTKQLLNWRKFYTKGVINAGESFLIAQDEIGGEYDYKDFSEVVAKWEKSEEYKYYTFDNFCLKAYGDPAVSPAPDTPAINDNYITTANTEDSTPYFIMIIIAAMFVAFVGAVFYKVRH